MVSECWHDDCTDHSSDAIRRRRSRRSGVTMGITDQAARLQPIYAGRLGRYGSSGAGTRRHLDCRRRHLRGRRDVQPTSDDDHTGRGDHTRCRLVDVAVLLDDWRKCDRRIRHRHTTLLHGWLGVPAHDVIIGVDQRGAVHRLQGHQCVLHEVDWTSSQVN